MIKEAIAKLVKKEDLTAGQMNDVMEEIMTGEATDAQKAAFLTALAAKGETIDEITAAARVLRAHCEKFLNDMDVLERRTDFKKVNQILEEERKRTDVFLKQVLLEVKSDEK